jgi:hypothetical protein
LRPAVASSPWVCAHWHPLGFIAENLAFEDPNLDAENPVSGTGHFGGVIDLSSKGVQGHTTFSRPFGTGDFCAVEATPYLDFEPEDSSSLGPLDGHADGAAEGNALFKLLGDVFSQQESIGIDSLHFDHVDPNLSAVITNSFLDA